MLPPRVLSYLKKQLKERRFSSKKYKYQVLQHMIADLHWTKDEDEDAENAWLEIVQLSVKDTGRRNGSSHAVRSCNRPGKLFEYRNQDAVAEQYLILAAEEATRLWSCEDPNVARHVGHLERFLLRSNRYEEVDQLKQQYAEVYRGLDKYRLGHGSLEAA